MRKQFHLLPECEIQISSNLGVVEGHCTDDIEWKNEKGELWFNPPSLIAIVKTKKYHRCNLCGHSIERHYNIIHTLTKRDYYIGIYSSCPAPYWGYDIKLCVECAKEVFKSTKMYECNNSFLCYGSYGKPTIDKPTIIFTEILEKTCSVKES